MKPGLSMYDPHDPVKPHFSQKNCVIMYTISQNQLPEVFCKKNMLLIS